MTCKKQMIMMMVLIGCALAQPLASVQVGSARYVFKSQGIHPHDAFIRRGEEKELGWGSGGLVFTYLKNGKSLVAGKRIGDKLKARAEREVSFLKRINHPGIVRFHDEYKSGGTTYIFMERCDCDLSDKKEKKRYRINLDEMSQDDKDRAENVCRKAVRQLLEALGYLHKNRIVHQDLKPSNIMRVKQEDRVKIIDFDLATDFKERGSTAGINGTWHYMAPEICYYKMATDSRITPKREGQQDIFALGIITCEMLLGKVLFEKRRPMSRDKNWKKDWSLERKRHYWLNTVTRENQLDDPRKPMVGMTEFDPEGTYFTKGRYFNDELTPEEIAELKATLSQLPDDCRKFVISCIAPKPEHRPSAKELLKSAWINNGSPGGRAKPRKRGQYTDPACRDIHDVCNDIEKKLASVNKPQPRFDFRRANRRDGTSPTRSHDRTAPESQVSASQPPQQAGENARSEMDCIESRLNGFKKLRDEPVSSGSSNRRSPQPKVPVSHRNSARKRNVSQQEKHGSANDLLDNVNRRVDKHTARVPDKADAKSNSDSSDHADLDDGQDSGAASESSLRDDDDTRGDRKGEGGGRTTRDRGLNVPNRAGKPNWFLSKAKEYWKAIAVVSLGAIGGLWWLSRSSSKAPEKSEEVSGFGTKLGAPEWFTISSIIGVMIVFRDKICSMFPNLFGSKMDSDDADSSVGFMFRPLSSSKNRTSKDDNMPIIIGVVSVFAILLVLVLVCVCCRRNPRQPYYDIEEGFGRRHSLEDDFRPRRNGFRRPAAFGGFWPERA